FSFHAPLYHFRHHVNMEMVFGVKGTVRIGYEKDHNGLLLLVALDPERQLVISRPLIGKYQDLILGEIELVDRFLEGREPDGLPNLLRTRERRGFGHFPRTQLLVLERKSNSPNLSDNRLSRFYPFAFLLVIRQLLRNDICLAKGRSIFSRRR